MKLRMDDIKEKFFDKPWKKITAICIVLVILIPSFFIIYKQTVKSDYYYSKEEYNHLGAPITDVPDHFGVLYKIYCERYTYISTPNGGKIHIFVQDKKNPVLFFWI